MTTATDINTTARQTTAKIPTSHLLEMTAMLGAQIASATDITERNAARVTIQWIYDELETRFPATIPVLEQWMDADADDRPYWQMMIDAVRQVIR